MKRKTILPLILMLFALSFSYSQFSLGVNAGTTFSNGIFKEKFDFCDPVSHIYYSKIADVEKPMTSKVSFTFSVLVESRLYSFLYLQAEVNWINHRSTLENNNSRLFSGEDMTGGPYTTDYNFKYIKIPLLLKAKLKYGKFYPYIFAGAGVGVLSKAEETFKPSYLRSITEETKQYQSFALYGLGTEYSLSDNVNLLFNIRHSNSFVDIANSPIVSYKPCNYDVLFGIKTNLIKY